MRRLARDIGYPVVVGVVVQDDRFSGFGGGSDHQMAASGRSPSSPRPMEGTETGTELATLLDAWSAGDRRTHSTG